MNADSTVGERVIYTALWQICLSTADTTIDLKAPIRDEMYRIGADSLDEIEMMMAIEDEFHISIEDDAACGFTCFQDVIDHVENTLKEKSK